VLTLHCYDLWSRNDQMTVGHVVGTRLKRSVKAAVLKQSLLFQPIRLKIELNTKSKLKASDFSSYILLVSTVSSASQSSQCMN